MVGLEDVCLSYWVLVTFSGAIFVKLREGILKFRWKGIDLELLASFGLESFAGLERVDQDGALAFWRWKTHTENLKVDHKRYTPQNKHGSPENGGPLEKEIPIGNHHFQVPC